MNVKKQNIKKYVLLLIMVLIAGALLMVSFIGTLINGEMFDSEDMLIKSETTYVIISLAGLLLTVVIIMTVKIRKKNKEIEYIESIDILPDVPELIEETEIEPESSSNENYGVRFCMLSKIDEKMETEPEPVYDDSFTLPELCEDFRLFCASTLKLYYDIDDIRRFISGMAVSHLLVMQGMSGTGKTSLAYAFGEYIQNSSTIVPIQPMWKERTDMVGYYNEFTKRFNETTLLCKMYEANYNTDMYIVVLDEMNIARVEYYFAEFLSLLEIPDPRKRMLDVVSDKWDSDPIKLRNGKICLPKNMWFIGTVNNDDSTFSISDKVYDRAMVLNLDKKAVRFSAKGGTKRRISAAYFTKTVNDVQSQGSISERTLDNVKALDEYIIDTFHITFGNRIMKQLNAYVPVFMACGGSELDAVDDIIAKKVLRKLEALNPVFVKNNAQQLADRISELFGEGYMPQCLDCLKHLQRNA